MWEAGQGMPGEKGRRGNSRPDHTTVSPVPPGAPRLHTGRQHTYTRPLGAQEALLQGWLMAKCRGAHPGAETVPIPAHDPPKPTAFPSVHLMEAAPLQGCQAAGSSTASRRMSSKRKPPGHWRPALAGSREGAGGGQAVQFRFCPSGVTQSPGTGRRRQLPAPVPDSGRRP